MIYLISDSKLLKIGYTSNLNNRLSGLKTGNPLVTIVAFKAGSKIDEKNLHEQCKKWHVDKEWYEDTIEVRQKFEEYDPFSNDQINLFKEVLSKALTRISEEKDYEYFLNKPIFNHFKEKVINIKNVPEEYSKMLGYLAEAEAYCNALYCIKYAKKEGLKYIKSEYKVCKTASWCISRDDLNSIINISKKDIYRYEELQKCVENLKIDLHNVKTDYAKYIIATRLKHDSENLNSLQKRIKENLDFVEEILNRIK